MTETKAEVRRYTIDQDYSELIEEGSEWYRRADFDSVVSQLSAARKERDLARERERSNEQQLCDISSVFGGKDACDAPPDGPLTIAAMVRHEVAVLREYAQHKPECVMREWHNTSEHRPPCDCGFRALTPTVKVKP